MITKTSHACLLTLINSLIVKKCTAQYDLHIPFKNHLLCFTEEIHDGLSSRREYMMIEFLVELNFELANCLPQS